MSIFDDREKAFERKFEQEQELRFKAKILRNKLLARWAADHLGFQGKGADEYVAGIVEGEFHHQRDDELVERIASDFAARGLAVDRYRIRAELARFAALANKQLKIAPSD